MPQKRGWGQAFPSSGRECGGWTNGSVACRSWEGEGVAARDAPWEQTGWFGKDATIFSYTPKKNCLVLSTILSGGTIDSSTVHIRLG
ncbi:hypothetical protein TNIN_270761 [Trichonephila inaurata madagascariensis]|uniref:Uncharacterized protein n=1 Tax=Trichonephila inaurata madagascariensis TaxID=2747483 RepID=A0A8X6XGI5_9ARAC|nr:hypothetical protein TNIN_270761 [Trichonephila inaurata madagascariensis]